MKEGPGVTRLTEEDIRRFQSFFVSLLARGDGHRCPEALFLQAAILAGLGDMVYVQGVTRVALNRRYRFKDDVTTSRS
jgi:hypothetical protein